MRRCFCLWLALGWIALAASAQEPAKTSIAIYPIKAAGAEASLAQALTSLLSTQLTPSPKLRVIEEAMLKTVMERQGLNASDACDDTTCQVQIGKLIQAQKIITGDIAKLGSKYVLSLKLIDIQTGALEFTTQDKCACPEDELDALVAVAGAKVRNHFGEAVPVPDLSRIVATAVAAPAQPGSARLAVAPGQKLVATQEVVDLFLKDVQGGNLEETQMLLNGYLGLANAKFAGDEPYKNSKGEIQGYKHKDWTPLHYAAQNGHKEVCSLLLANGADANARSTKQGYMTTWVEGGYAYIDIAEAVTPFELAAENKNKEVFDLLIEKSVPSNSEATKSSVWVWVCRNGWKDEAESLHAKGAMFDNDLMWCAACNGWKDIVEQLLSTSVSVDSKAIKKAIKCAEKSKHQDVADLLSQHLEKK